MPNKRAAVKALRQSKTKHLRNVRLTSELTTETRKFERCVREKDTTKAATQLAILFKRLDQALNKGVVHQNTVARKKSRLSLRLARLSA